ncbi:hypothetical protein J0H58_21720 [bacterium]|nr:hypothetical protein [bacterium]
MALLALACAIVLAGPAFDQRFAPTRPFVSQSSQRTTVELPTVKHLLDTGGSDELGLCLFTSIWHSAR